MILKMYNDGGHVRELYVHFDFELSIIDNKEEIALQMPDQTSSKYNFMVTISMPVFDRRENAVSNVFY